MTTSSWLHTRWRALLISLRLAVPRPGEKAPTPPSPTRPAWMREEVEWVVRVGVIAVLLVATDTVLGDNGWADAAASAAGFPLGMALVWKLPKNRLTRDPNRVEEHGDDDAEGPWA